MEALYAYPDEETVPAFTEETGEGSEEEMGMDQTILDLYNKLRILPQDTWFEFDTGTERAYRAKLSWYNPMTDHFLFVTPRGRKSMLLDIRVLAEQIRSGKTVYFKNVKGSFWNRAMRTIMLLLERDTEPSVKQAR
ncbi:MAG TPA: DUF1631 family protein [Chromatiaceae bacterium]|nr:DUF1631 family protein [Chromatiaceae bacterium]